MCRAVEELDTFTSLAPDPVKLGNELMKLVQCMGDDARLPHSCEVEIFVTAHLCYSRAGDLCATTIVLRRIKTSSAAYVEAGELWLLVRLLTVTREFVRLAPLLSTLIEEGGGRFLPELLAVVTREDNGSGVTGGTFRGTLRVEICEALGRRSFPHLDVLTRVFLQFGMRRELGEALWARGNAELRVLRALLLQRRRNRRVCFLSQWKKEKEMGDVASSRDALERSHGCVGERILIATQLYVEAATCTEGIALQLALRCRAVAELLVLQLGSSFYF